MPISAYPDNYRPQGEQAPPAGRRPAWKRAGLAAAVGGAVTVGLTGGSAFAYFTATGSGSAQAKVATAATVTVAAASATADLLPGGSGAAVFTLHNTNAYSVAFNTVTGASVVSNNTIACPSGNLSIAQAIPATLSPALTVAGGSTSGSLSVPNLIHLSSSAPSTCQGIGFTVTLTLSGSQS